MVKVDVVMLGVGIAANPSGMVIVAEGESKRQPNLRRGHLPERTYTLEIDRSRPNAEESGRRAFGS
jgi:hypothetical protein